MTDYTHHYKKWHDGTQFHANEIHQFYIQNFEKYWPKDKKARILDVGCGMGLALLTLKNEGFRNITGIDIDHGQVEASKNLGLDVQFAPNIKDFFETQKTGFDFIMALDVLEHIHPSEQNKFLSEIYNALKPQGHFLCTVPNGNSSLAARWRYIDWTHKTAFTEHSLEFILNASGFTHISINEIGLFKRYNSKPSFLKKGFEKILNRAARLWRRVEMIAELGFDEGHKVPLSVNIVAICKK